MPTMGEVTVGWASSQASATWAGDTPRRSARSEHLLDDHPVLVPIEGGDRTRRSRTAQVWASHGRVSRPRASGLHGMTPTPWSWHSGQHLPLLLAVDQVVVVLHGHEAASSRGARPRAASWRTARRTSRRPRGSGPCPPCTTSCSASMVSSIGRHRVEPVDLVEVDVVGAEPASGWRRSPAGSPCATVRRRWGRAASGRRPWWRGRRPRGRRASTASGRCTPRWCRRSRRWRCRRS